MHVLVAQVQGAELHGAGQHLIEIQQHLLRGHLAGKTEQAGDQGLGAQRLRADFLHQRPEARRQPGIFLQHVGESEDGGERVVDFVGRARGQLPERRELLRLHQLVLQAAQILERFFRAVQQFLALAVHQVLPPEDQRVQDQHGRKRQIQAVTAHGRRDFAQQLAPDGHQRQGNERGHGQPRGPDAVARRSVARVLHAAHRTVGHKARGAEHRERCHQRDVVEASGVIGEVVNGQVEERRAGQVHGPGKKERAVDFAPGSPGLPEQRGQAGEQNQVFAIVKIIEGAAVVGHIGHHKLPGNHKEKIEIDPPAEQQGEIHHPEGKAALAARLVRRESQCRDHRDGVQKEDGIAWKRIRRRLVEKHFVTGPIDLAEHPQRASQGEQQPEPILFPARRGGIQQQAGIRQQGNEALDRVSERGQALARPQEQGSGNVAADQENPARSDPPGGKEDSEAGVRGRTWRHTFAPCKRGCSGTRHGNLCRETLAFQCPKNTGTKVTVLRALLRPSRNGKCDLGARPPPAKSDRAPLNGPGI